MEFCPCTVQTSRHTASSRAWPSQVIHALSHGPVSLPGLLKSCLPYSAVHSPQSTNPDQYTLLHSPQSTVPDQHSIHARSTCFICTFAMVHLDLRHTPHALGNMTTYQTPTRARANTHTHTHTRTHTVGNSPRGAPTQSLGATPCSHPTIA